MNFWTIFKKELRAYFVSPSFYAVLFIFLVLSGYFFYTDTVMFNWSNSQGNASVTMGLWQYYFNDIRFIMIFLLPLITMKIFSEEKRLGTIELLTTYPVRDIEILAGKFLACIVIFLLMLSLTFINVILVGIIWDFSEIGPVFCGYFGIFLLGSSLIACGLFVSSLTENQMLAAIGTMGLFILFWFLTWNEMIANEQVINLLKKLSLFDRVFDFFKGVINTRDIAFFLFFIGYFLFMTLKSLETRAWKGVK
jgi:ABC-2 type transport system permease protein